MTATSASPCDSPAVQKRSINARFYRKAITRPVETQHAASLPEKKAGEIAGLQHDRAHFIVELWVAVVAASAELAFVFVAGSAASMPVDFGTADSGTAGQQDHLMACPGLKPLPQLVRRRQPSGRGDFAGVRPRWRCWPQDRSGRIPAR